MTARPRLAGTVLHVALLAGFAAAQGPAYGADPASTLEVLDGGYRWNLPDWLPRPPVPDDNPMSAAKVSLGRHLFFDARLSADGTIACSSCHEPTRAFSDGERAAEGVGGARGHRNAQGLANVGYWPVLTWASPVLDSLEVHALTPLFGDAPVEMGNVGREQALFDRLSVDARYARMFAEAFPARDGEVSLFTITRALAAFQRSLISADSPYDRYKYGGDGAALSTSAKRGEELFFSERLECYHCHQGFNFTDTFATARSGFRERAFHNTGLYDVDGEGSYPAIDQGLYAVSTDPRDRGRFRTPSLRNLAFTAPYFHDGSAATLDEVLDHYEAGGRHIDSGPDAGDGSRNPMKNPLVLGFSLQPDERADVLAFLASLDDPGFVSEPAHADPWPSRHPASIARRDVAPLSIGADVDAPRGHGTALPIAVVLALGLFWLVASVARDAHPHRFDTDPFA